MILEIQGPNIWPVASLCWCSTDAEGSRHRGRACPPSCLLPSELSRGLTFWPLTSRIVFPGLSCHSLRPGSHPPAYPRLPLSPGTSKHPPCSLCSASPVPGQGVTPLTSSCLWVPASCLGTDPSLPRGHLLVFLPLSLSGKRWVHQPADLSPRSNVLMH